MRLRPGRERAVRQGHPWVFSGALEPPVGEPAPAAGLVLVESAGGEPLAWGLWSPKSQIRVRRLAGAGETIDAAWFARRIDRALELRASVLPPETTGYRILNAEGDGLPGFSVDRFGDVLVSQISCAGLEAMREPLYSALRSRCPGYAVLQVNDLAARRLEGLPTENEWIAGAPRATAEFLERGLRLEADLVGGQKTGFYCDQRENRAHAEGHAAVRRVADLFAHSGAFGLSALRGGAAAVSFVESSAETIERGRRQVAANFPAADGPASRAEWIKADVFTWLREAAAGSFDLIVCDPPPLARRRDDVERAARAYKDLNRLAFRALRPGGFLYTFSCSGAIDAKLLRQILFSAALEAGVEARLLAPLAAAADHPVSIHHPEGEYLKGWWIAV